MATAVVSEELQERIETARKLHWELTRCQTELEAVRDGILRRQQPEEIRRQFRACQSAMMMAGRLLLLDGRFKPRLPSDVRGQALDLLRAGAMPIEVQRKFGVGNGTIYRLRHRELGDNRDLRKIRKRLNDEQIAEIRAAGYGTVRRVFAEKFGVSMSLVSRVRNGRGVYRQPIKVLSSPVETTEAKQPGPSNELSLRLNRELLETLVQMAQLASSDLAEYAAALLEAQVADFRAKKIPSDFLYRGRDAKAPPETGSTLKQSRYRGMSAETSQRIIHLHFDEGISERVIAERFGLGESTVRRVTSAYKRAEHVQIPATKPEPRPGGWDRRI